MVHEPDDTEAVLGVLRDLVGEQLCNAARPHDDDVLDVRALPSPNRTAHGTEERNEEHGKKPEHNESTEIRSRQVRDMRDDEKAPRSERDDLKDADNVVDGRVIRSLLVAVVETVNPREQHPERERREEECGLPHRSDAVCP